MVSSSISLLPQTHLPLNFFFVMRLTRLPQTHLPLYFFFLWNTWTWKAGLRLLLSMRPHVAAAGVWGVSCVFSASLYCLLLLVVGLVAKIFFGGEGLFWSLRIELFSFNHKFQNLPYSILVSFWVSLVLGVIAKIVFSFSLSDSTKSTQLTSTT